ncbi:M36 family metallopeptidase, partial [Aeromonas caviae]|uniref:M36 family metallopeptidase n=2 Tax=Gammaproteobacteria TaxID=1236 RepID=UPI00214DEB7B
PGVFDYSFQAGDAPFTDSARNNAIVNLFYVNNWLHDYWYDAGFNEAAGNAQANNYGRGGTGGDPIQAQAQDWGGRNNANMTTPADGRSP